MNRPRIPARARGAHFEQLAERMLREAGLRFVTRNFTCRVGEIDLVMEDHATLVFVEVRYRESSEFGDPLATISHLKQRRLIRAAQAFLQAHPRYATHACRFDAIGITGSAERPEMRWIRHAFSA